MVDETGKKELGQSRNDGSNLIVPGDYLATLVNCGGYYDCPVTESGMPMPLGPLVGYAGSYIDDMTGGTVQFVGFKYFNFSEVDQWPAVLQAFAEQAVRMLADRSFDPTVVVGMPMAGIRFGDKVASILRCRSIYAEKKVISAGSDGQRPKEEIKLVRYEILPGDRVVIAEELVNNRTSTAQVIADVERAGGRVIAVIAAINRSYPFVNGITDSVGRKIPIIAVIDRETPQYRQEHPLVREAVAQGNIVWQPKKGDWPRLRQAMRDHGMFN